MKAIIRHPDKRGKIIQVQKDIPKPGMDEVLIKVKAFGINRADILQTLGLYPLPASVTDIIGLELSGEIVKIGKEVNNLRLGQDVCALVDGGAYAEYIVVKANMIMSFDNMNIVELAATPESFLTAYQCLFTIGNLQANQQVLIHAGAGSVGSSAIQLAKHSGAYVFSSCSTQKVKICQNLGADHVIDYEKSEFSEQILARSNKASVDLVLDFVGSTYAQQHLKILNKDAKWILIGLLGGAKIEQLDLRPFLFNRISLIGTTLRNRSQAYKVALTNAFVERFGKYLNNRSMTPLIDSVHSWNKVESCFNKVTNNKTIGKIVCLID